MVFLASGLFLFGAAVIFALPGAEEEVITRGEASSIPVTVNYPAPELTLSDLQGNPSSLTDYLGQVVLVNNWATWCPPCKAEMPALQAYYQTHTAQGFVILGIEAGEPADEVTAFVEQYGLTFPVWLDAKGLALEAFRNFSLPSSYVIDRDGVVRLAWSGAISREMLEKYVTPVVVEK
ncbi:MAG: TlpA family protein disulfide reductase [Chloroflexi bacterium]|nr:TlpA family protein disulfide reductase [Chloroflexota bacterium]